MATGLGRAGTRPHHRAMVAQPMISAAARALPPERPGVGLGILQGPGLWARARARPVLGVPVTARQQAGTDALNPLHVADAAAAYSDAFLAMAAIALLAKIVAQAAPGSRRRRPYRPGDVSRRRAGPKRRSAAPGGAAFDQGG